MRVRRVAFHAAGLLISLSLLASSAAAGTSALSLRWARTPKFPGPRVVAAGRIPQLPGDGVKLTRANEAIRRVVLADETAFLHFVEWLHPSPKAPLGSYQPEPDVRLISASTVVVSALIPTWKAPPGDGEIEWLAFTVDVARGDRVQLRNLFSNASRGLTALAAAARRRLLLENACVRDSGRDNPVPPDEFSRGFRPTVQHYRYFALLPRGVEIGFPVGDVAYPTCGRVRVSVPYRVLRPYLSRDGRKLVAGVRPPIR